MLQDTRHERDRHLLLAPEAANLFPQHQQIRERLGAIARFYGNFIGVKFGEPFVVKETLWVDDITAMGVRSL